MFSWQTDSQGGQWYAYVIAATAGQVILQRSFCTGLRVTPWPHNSLPARFKIGRTARATAAALMYKERASPPLALIFGVEGILF